MVLKQCPKVLLPTIASGLIESAGRITDNNNEPSLYGDIYELEFRI